MKKVLVVMLAAVLVSLAFIGCSPKPAPDAAPPKVLRLATTTSTADSGLLDFIIPDFEAKYNYRVDVVAVGTGQALEIGRLGDADVLLVHAKAQEEKFVAEGFGTKRLDVMYNDFVVIGPKDDPAGIKSAKATVEALTTIYELGQQGKVVFLSRGDNSGTHSKEKSLWTAAKLEIKESDQWYKSIGQGMGATLTTANEMKGYTLADRGTYLSMMNNIPNLTIVFEGDNNLFNQYGIIPVNSAKHQNIDAEGAELFVAFFVSSETQKKIGEYGKEKFGQPLFFPNAK